ncbi:Diaminopimelate epimerase-like protein [Mycena venus]|uniref:Diaminopimelate epimerase-like protein n=1 Tax=Mycena venus TaxID=2733690 RepID=A0A8H6XKR4_9AGAR|nr:Diaminopimelate epimerase-like protein [Mycena venus]
MNQSLNTLDISHFSTMQNRSADRMDFEIVTAFTTSIFGGNPAAIVFLDKMLPNEVLQKVNDNFNQPIGVFVFPPESNTPPKNGRAVFGLRWFGPRNEMRICGHGTLAAAEVIFRRLEPAENITTLEFETLSGILTAHRVGDQISMELPAGTTVPASPEESAVVGNIFARALAKPIVNIRYVGYGGPGFTNYLLVEVDEAENLSEWRPNTDAFAELGPRTQILVVTSAGRTKGIAYETRMFAPTIGVPEDHVCGSAHCLNAPYWAAKAQDGGVAGGLADGKPQHAKAVSARGGDIWASYFATRDRVQIRGHVKPVAVGTLDLTDILN